MGPGVGDTSSQFSRLLLGAPICPGPRGPVVPAGPCPALSAASLAHGCRGPLEGPGEVRAPLQGRHPCFCMWCVMWQDRLAHAFPPSPSLDLPTIGGLGW